MGAEMSTRKITFENDGKFIRCSESIVRRLVQKSQEDAQESAEDEKPVERPAPEVPPPQNQSAASGYPVYYPQMTLSALEVQQQKEQELESQEQYWQRRLQNLEKHHERVNRIIKEEYEKAVKENASRKDGRRVIRENTAQPCLDSSEKVLKCYQDYPKETLKCSSLVEEFSNCVDKRRTNIIAARC